MSSDKTKKLIGMIGGTGWVSTLQYYRLINEMIYERSGGRNYAHCLLYSLDYSDIGDLVEKNDYEGIYRLVKTAAKKLQNGRVDFLVLCANTLHMFVSRLDSEISLPIIHIAEATALKIKADHLSTVGLIGTKRTMEDDFYRLRLLAHGISTLIPVAPDRDFIDHTIRKELVNNIFTSEANAQFLRIIDSLENQGAQAVIMGCTEIPLLVKQEHTSIKLYDTTEIHASAVVDFYLTG